MLRSVSPAYWEAKRKAAARQAKRAEHERAVKSVENDLFVRAVAAERKMKPKLITYSHNARGDIILPKCAPFDGSEVLIKVGAGWFRRVGWMRKQRTTTKASPMLKAFAGYALTTTTTQKN